MRHSIFQMIIGQNGMMFQGLPIVMAMMIENCGQTSLIL